VIEEKAAPKSRGAQANSELGAKTVREVVLKKHPFLVVLFLSLLTSSIAMYGAWMDSGFPYMNMADSAIVYNSGHITINPFPSGGGSSQNNVANVRSSRLMVVLLPVFLSKVLGIPLTVLTFFPLTGILIPLIGYLVVRKLMASELWGVVFGAYLALEAQGLLRDYNMNIQGYGQLFFLLTILLVSESYLHKTNRRYYFLTIVFFAMTLLSYYSSEFYSLIFIIALALLLKIKKIYSPRSRFVTNIALTFGIITLAFEPMVGSYSQKLLAGETSHIPDILARFLDGALRVFGFGVSVEHTAAVIATPIYLLIINILLFVIIFLPILLFVPKMIKGKRYQEVLVICLILVGAMDVVAYSGLAGHVDLKFIYLFFPICSIIAISYILTRRRSRFLYLLKIGFVIGLISLMSLRFALYASGPYSGMSENRYISYQFNTVANQSGLQRTYLTDNIAAGKLLLSFAQTEFYNSVAIVQYPSLSGVHFLYSGNLSDLVYLEEAMGGEMPDYILVSSYSLKGNFPAQGWYSFPPFDNYTEIVNGVGVEIVYDCQDFTVLRLPSTNP
jgi:hypothetical protein